MVNSSGVELLIFYFPPVPQAPLGVIQRLHLRCILSLHIIFNYQFRGNRNNLELGANVESHFTKIESSTQNAERGTRNTEPNQPIN